MAANQQDKSVIPNLPICGVKSLHSPFLHAALEWTKLHTNSATVNHSLRSACFALLAIRKLPHLANVDKDLVVFSCIMHDMGCSKNVTLISKDKRFEVDGANIARNWIRERINDIKWSEHQLQLTWDAIALHTTSSIFLHKESEVVAVGLGISADIGGPSMPQAFVTEEEFKEVIAAIPRLDLADEMVDILCGLCRDKPDTTYDNFVSDFGVRFGLDGKGLGKKEFAQRLEERSIAKFLVNSIKAGDELEEN